MSDYECEKEGYYSNKYSRTDTYYCEKCCDTKEIVSRLECRDVSNGIPGWWK